MVGGQLAGDAKRHPESVAFQAEVGGDAPWRRCDHLDNGAVQIDDGFFPDGMVFYDGRLYVTGSDGNCIAVVNHGGEIVDMIETPPGRVPTNLCAQGSTLWVTFGVSGQVAAYHL